MRRSEIVAYVEPTWRSDPPCPVPTAPRSVDPYEMSADAPVLDAPTLTAETLTAWSLPRLWTW